MEFPIPTAASNPTGIGAGACGLAYELHLRHRASETVAVDVDPYLLVIGERVVRGERVPLTEASLKVMDVDDVSRAWTLSVPSSALGPEAFRALFADGTAPPFAPSSFDTVVTPWFIDQVPRDLPAFIGTVHQLLRPGGCWLNQGPLIYPEQVPFERRYSQNELLELVREQGFVVDSSRASQPYLVSPLSRSRQNRGGAELLGEARRSLKRLRHRASPRSW